MSKSSLASQGRPQVRLRVGTTLLSPALLAVTLVVGPGLCQEEVRPPVQTLVPDVVPVGVHPVHGAPSAPVRPVKVEGSQVLSRTDTPLSSDDGREPGAWGARRGPLGQPSQVAGPGRPPLRPLPVQAPPAGFYLPVAEVVLPPGPAPEGRANALVVSLGPERARPPAHAPGPDTETIGPVAGPRPSGPPRRRPLPAPEPRPRVPAGNEVAPHTRPRPRRDPSGTPRRGRPPPRAPSVPRLLRYPADRQPGRHLHRLQGVLDLRPGPGRRPPARGQDPRRGVRHQPPATPPARTDCRVQDFDFR